MPEARYDVTTLGETLLRISVPPGVPLETAQSAALAPAGSESNVACTLARLGRRVAWCSRLPDNPPARLITNVLRQAGVDLSLVTWCDSGRVATFFVELAQPPTPVRVTYDRAGSCASEMSPESIDWSKLLDTRLLHLTGITPALSASCRRTVEEAVRRADEAGVPRTLDINYRRKLWSPEQARDARVRRAGGAAFVFRSAAWGGQVRGDPRDPETAVAKIRDLTGAQRIVLTVGEAGTIAWDGRAVVRQPAFPTSILDRLGAGDALAAGVVHGVLDGDFAAGLRHGAALAARCLATHGDVPIVYPADLAEMSGSQSARPSR
jgi:2-dehydro-3-deoxygluconokinase